jgi:hypothetical protein
MGRGNSEDWQRCLEFCRKEGKLLVGCMVVTLAKQLQRIHVPSLIAIDLQGHAMKNLVRVLAKKTPRQGRMFQESSQEPPSNKHVLIVLRSWAFEKNSMCLFVHRMVLAITSGHAGG